HSLNVVCNRILSRPHVHQRNLSCGSPFEMGVPVRPELTNGLASLRLYTGYLVMVECSRDHLSPSPDPFSSLLFPPSISPRFPLLHLPNSLHNSQFLHRRIAIDSLLLRYLPVRIPYSRLHRPPFLLFSSHRIHHSNLLFTSSSIRVRPDRQMLRRQAELRRARVTSRFSSCPCRFLPSRGHPLGVHEPSGQRGQN
ncbi:hypothetical protein PFISCL1PPCAC_27617, partial [Pristionchus fissidentatus]